MKSNLLLKVFLLAFSGVAASQVAAQDVAFGKTEFLQRCAVCHGDEGNGDGIVGELFARKPANLQLLAKENGGVYPLTDAVISLGMAERICLSGVTT